MNIAENNFSQSIILTQLLQSLQFQLLIEHPCTLYHKNILDILVMTCLSKTRMNLSFPLMRININERIQKKVQTTQNAQHQRGPSKGIHKCSRRCPLLDARMLCL